MRNLPPTGALSLIAMLLAGPVLAQQSPSERPPTAAGQQPVTPAPPSTAQEQPSANTAGPASTGDAHLVVVAVTLKDGLRASKLIGSPVFNDQNEKVGSIDDLMLTHPNKLAMAIISVGGFLGAGNKLVAVPIEQLRLETTKDNRDKVHLLGGSKDALNAMPNFTYSNS